MRFGTGIMLGAFVVIILSTTFSTADWVVSLGKVMYWVIVSITLLSLCIWVVRSQLSGKSENMKDITPEEALNHPTE